MSFIVKEDLATIISTYVPPFPTIQDMINEPERHQEAIRTLQRIRNECNEALEKYKRAVAENKEKE